MAEQYDVSEKIYKLYKIKDAQRKASKAYYQKLLLNPHRPKIDETIFDPVAQRFSALLHYQVEQYKPNARSMKSVIGLLFLPLTAVVSAIYWETTTRENEIRSGNVAYKDRLFKMLL